ncbi:hypothetical protein [Marinobacter sp. NP-6]|jgi:hypothetical protein|uniref:hypothetical protein n=1 Tax=unclassified Marinobacter TaxID=83889 RepID=UPI00055E98DA|nr:hypothetical protein [Marinobacter sp. NP-6]RUT74410.1 hypothetical protein EHM94_04170 [Marinobacter sp. NP-6]
MKYFQKILRLAGPVVLIVLVSACASTEMTSRANPELEGRAFDKVLVFGKFQNLNHREVAESEFCSNLGRLTNSECIKSSEVFFVGESQSAEQIDARVKEQEIDAVLILQPSDSGTSSSYVPPSYETQSNATVTGNMISGSSTTYTYGGYTLNKPWAKYEVSLIAIVDGRVAWYATGQSRGNAYAGWDDLIESATSESVKKLVSDGVLRKADP